MKSIFGLCLLALASIALADGSLSYKWTTSTDTNVSGYNFYFGPASRDYTNEISLGNVTNITITGLVDGATYYVAVTAYDPVGDESDFSNELTNTVPIVLDAPLLSVANVPLPQPTSLTNVPLFSTSFFQPSSWSNEADVLVMVTNPPACVSICESNITIANGMPGVVKVTVPVYVTFTYTNVVPNSNKFWTTSTNH